MMNKPIQLARALAERFVEIREREQAVVAELTAYRELVDLSPCPMVLSTKDGVIVYVNRSYREMLEVELESVVVNGWHNYVADRDRQRVIDLWQKAVKEGQTEIISTVIFKTPKGELPVYWKARLMEGNGYAIAIYHPGCQFLSTQTGQEVIRCAGCSVA